MGGERSLGIGTLFKTEPVRTWAVAKAPAWVCGGVEEFGGRVTFRLGAC